MLDQAAIAFLALFLSATPPNLDDASFRALEPELFETLAGNLPPAPDPASLVDRTRLMLGAHGLQAQVSGRTKSLASLHRKALRKGVDPEQIMDRTGLRVVVPTVADCYAVMGLLHQQHPALPEEFDDYILDPKPSGYQSLHAALRAGPRGEVVEFQVRTADMHAEAETGVAAHWRYKLQA